MQSYVTPNEEILETTGYMEQSCSSTFVIHTPRYISIIMAQYNIILSIFVNMLSVILQFITFEAVFYVRHHANLWPIPESAKSWTVALSQHSCNTIKYGTPYNYTSLLRINAGAKPNILFSIHDVISKTNSHLPHLCMYYLIVNWWW